MPIRQTIVDGLYLLCGINVAPPHISDGQFHPSLRNTNKETTLCILSSSPYEQDPARKRLKSRNSFLHSVEPLDGSARTRRLTLWSRHLQTTPHKLPFSPKDWQPPGSSEAWPTWSTRNRLRIGTGRCKVQEFGWIGLIAKYDRKSKAESVAT